jgi:hypothetical protein
MIPSYARRDDPDINTVWTWFEFQIALIGESRGSVLGSLRLASGVVGEALLPHEERFVGATRGEVEEFFDAQRGQLELLTMFELLSTTEAILRIEFSARVAARKKDGLSRRFRKLHKVNRDKIRLDDDILGAMKDEGIPANVIADFRGALRLRHWLAHGRHWHPKLGRGYAPSDVFDISRALIDSIPPS